MTYEYEHLGKGISVPSVRMGLTDLAAGRLKEEIFQIVDRDGALLFRDTGIDSPVRYAEFLDSIDFHHHSYMGGTAPRTDLGRGVYTATDLPADTTVMVHQEMAYLDNAPDYISFYSHKPPENGQKTHLLADARMLAERLPAEIRERYRGKHARLRRTLAPAGSASVLSRREKSWQEVLGTDDRTEAVAIGEQKNWELRWTDDDYLIIVQEPARFFRPHPLHGEIWCNPALAFQPMTRFLIAERDGRAEDARRTRIAMANAPDSIDAMIMDDGSRVPPEDAATWFEICTAAATPHAMARGDLIILDNMLMAHGRSTFTGTRTVYTALGDRAV